MIRENLMTIDLLLADVAELVCVSINGKPKYGSEMNDPEVLKDISVAIDHGVILEVGKRDILSAKYIPNLQIDCSQRVVTPGWVDPHTHPVFVHTRENEFALRIQGRSYVEISQSGGGIRSTIRTTRNSSEEELYELAKKRILQMLCQGTTTLEAKSGYGLTTESELKQLKVIGKLAEDLPVDIIPTFMGAHEYPEEYKNDHQRYIDILCNEMLPAVTEQKIAVYCDIFTEGHVFNLAESRKILAKAAELGLRLKMHADEIEPMGGAELAAEMHCVSADHLGMTSDQGIEALKRDGVVPVLLPATLFSLASKTYARARDMITANLPVAVATDYNPGSCNCDSMPFVTTLSCLQMRMTPAEAITAATINAAAAIQFEHRTGSITVGKQADLLVWDIPSYQYIPYHIGSSNPELIIKNGVVLNLNHQTQKI